MGAIITEMARCGKLGEMGFVADMRDLSTKDTKSIRRVLAG